MINFVFKKQNVMYFKPGHISIYLSVNNFKIIALFPPPPTLATNRFTTFVSTTPAVHIVYSFINI